MYIFHVSIITQNFLALYLALVSRLSLKVALFLQLIVGTLKTEVSFRYRISGNLVSWLRESNGDIYRVAMLEAFFC